MESEKPTQCPDCKRMSCYDYNGRQVCQDCYTEAIEQFEAPFIVGLGAVDGVRRYDITTPSAEEALKFIALYDHEGSNLYVYWKEFEYLNEEGYRFLESKTDDPWAGPNWVGKRVDE